MKPNYVRKDSACDMIICTTPRGNEIVKPSWLQEPTRIMTPEELKQIMDEYNRQLTVHTKPTVREMPAVRPQGKKF